MRRVLLSIFVYGCLSACLAGSARAQFFKDPTELLPTTGILRNSVTNLHAEGDTLWAGPFLNVTSDGGDAWFVADIDSLAGTRNSLFSLDVEGPVIWAGLGYSTVEDGSAVPAVAGYAFSADGGRTFTLQGPHLDAPDDTTVTYGISTLPALAVIVPEQSPPYDIDYDPVSGDVWIAGWASGIRRSSDEGRTWQRVVLPPDSLDFIDPDSSYSFEVAPQRGGMGHLNHMGFSVLVDEEGTVWAGTPRGVNRSTDGLTWRRFSADGTPQSLTGSWVTSIEEQPVDGRNPIWMATWNAGELGERGRFGVTVTKDGGASFEQYLIGERIHDFAFRDAHTVFAAGENGLFISNDDGITWRTVRRFRDAEDADQIVRPDVSVYAVATTREALWVGTSDGLMKSEDGGDTWRVYRAEVPLHPDEPSAAVPEVDTYAYPNPFSPRADRFVRIRYESGGGRDRLRIFDFGMNLVRELASEDTRDGVRELTWDGTDEGGFRVANGVYFYAVETRGDPVRGKIHVLE
jgi:hypothetical protein